MNNFAWFILTEKGLKHPDYKEALELAKKAVALDKGRNGYSLDTLALAYFKNGFLEKAVEYQKKAVSIGPVDQEMKNRLEMFKEALERKRKKSK